MRPATLVLTAHGSADPRAAANTYAVAADVRRMRPGADVRVAFCEHSVPNLRDVLVDVGDHAIVTPLLLADAYHARIDIPALIADSGAVQANVLGEDHRLVTVLRQRVRDLGVSSFDPEVGVVVVAVGSSRRDANARTANVAPSLTAGTRWAGVTAFATGPRPTLGEAAQRLRSMGARRLVIAPWFLAHGRITDRVAEYATAHGIPMAEPLGANRLVAATVLNRFDAALAESSGLAA